MCWMPAKFQSQQECFENCTWMSDIDSPDFWQILIQSITTFKKELFKLELTLFLYLTAQTSNKDTPPPPFSEKRLLANSGSIHHNI